MLFFCEKPPPGLTVAIWPVRAHLRGHLADQLVRELARATGTIDFELERTGDVAPRRLAVDTDPVGDGAPRRLAVATDPVGDGAFNLAFQSASSRLLDLDHSYLPEHHWPPPR